MNSIYNIDNSLLIKSLLPILMRTPAQIALMESFLTPFIRLNDNLNDYIYGSSYSYYSNSTTYNNGDIVNGGPSFSFATYESQINNNIGNILSGTAWGIWNQYGIGMDIRKYGSSNKMEFEYILNGFYNTTFRQPNSATISTTHSYIYITDNIIRTPVFLVGYSNNSSHVYSDRSDGFIFGTGSNASFLADHFYTSAQYNINVPSVLLNTLNGTTSNIRLQADKLNECGLLYNVIPY